MDTRQNLPTKQLDGASFVLSSDLSRTEHKVHHAYSGERLEDPETLDDGVGAARKKHAAHAEWRGIRKLTLVRLRNLWGAAR